MNHTLLIQKLYNTTQDSKLCRVIQNLLSNRRFYVELNNECSRWRKKKNCLPQGSGLVPTVNRATIAGDGWFRVLVPTLFNIYTNDQPIHLRNKEANRLLKVVWNETELENTSYPKYFGYKHHIQTTKMKTE